MRSIRQRSSQGAHAPQRKEGGASRPAIPLTSTISNMKPGQRRPGFFGVHDDWVNGTAPLRPLRLLQAVYSRNSENCGSGPRGKLGIYSLCRKSA